MKSANLQVTAVLLGTDIQSEHHFMALKLEEQPEEKDVRMICDLLERYFLENGIFVQREFVKSEVHLHPSAKSAQYFKTKDGALREYQKILNTLGLSAWSNEIAIDGSLLPFAERSEALSQAIKTRFWCHSRRHF